MKFVVGRPFLYIHIKIKSIDIFAEFECGWVRQIATEL